MPDVDDATLDDLLARSHGETDQPIDPTPLVTSSIKAPGDVPLSAASDYTRKTYAEDLDELASDIAIGDGEKSARAAGTAPPIALTKPLAQQWDTAIRETVANRHGLVNYLQQHYRGLIAQAQAQIADRQTQLAKQKRAFADVQEAVKAGEDAERWTGILLKINEAYEGIDEVTKSEIGFDPALIGIEAANFARNQVYGSSQIIEAGVRDLGDYGVALALVSDGYASIAELNTAMQTTLDTIGAASDQIVTNTQALAALAPRAL